MTTDTQQAITIEGIDEPAISNYFATINQEDFAQTADLFAEDGELHAPFEQPIIGRKAISSYLTKEAKGMILLPIQGVYEATEGSIKQIRVSGKVKTSLFSVNVAWHFSLDRDRQIATARIKLIASPQELLGLKKFQN